MKNTPGMQVYQLWLRRLGFWVLLALALTPLVGLIVLLASDVRKKEDNRDASVAPGSSP